MEYIDMPATVKELMQEITRVFCAMEKNVSISCGITPSQWSTLLAFSDADALKMNELSKRLALATSTMTRMIDNLVKEGLVERRQDFADRRSVMVYLTTEGKHLTEKLHRIESECFNTLLGHMDVEMRGQVVDSLHNLLLAFRKFDAPF